MQYIVIQSDDIKTKKLNESTKKYGVQLISVAGSPIKIPVYLINYIVKRGKPIGVIYRYLNGYPNLFKDLLRLISEVFSIFICRVLKIKIVWICHNLDRESIIFNEKITKIRRTLFERFSHKILVTDPLLINKAKKILPFAKDKIDYITFGGYIETPTNYESHRLTKLIIDFIREQNNKNVKKPMFGLCVGNANWKTAHFERIPKLLDKSEMIGRPIRLIVVGPLGSYYSRTNPKLIDKLKSDPRIFFYNKFISIDEDKISKYIDFYWRAYRDLSTPFTVYHSAKVKKPILAQGPGFLKEMVENYNLGATVKDNFEDLEYALNRLRDWDPRFAEEFLESHNWDIGARQLIKACR